MYKRGPIGVLTLHTRLLIVVVVGSLGREL